jgi:hypothetical protein
MYRLSLVSNKPPQSVDVPIQRDLICLIVAMAPAQSSAP